MIKYYQDGDVESFVVRVEDGVAEAWNYHAKKWEQSPAAREVAQDIYNHVEIGDGDAENKIKEYSERAERR